MSNVVFMGRRTEGKLYRIEFLRETNLMTRVIILSRFSLIFVFISYSYIIGIKLLPNLNVTMCVMRCCDFPLFPDIDKPT